MTTLQHSSRKGKISAADPEKDSRRPEGDLAQIPL
jgi:hypothetical protein